MRFTVMSLLPSCTHRFMIQGSPWALKTGKDPGKTRLEHSQIFVDFEENKKKRSFKRKMVLGIIPNTKFVYSLKGHPENQDVLFMKRSAYYLRKRRLTKARRSKCRDFV